MLGAIVYVRLDRRLAAAKRGEPLRLWVRAGALLLFAAGVYVLQLILRIQSTNGLISHEQLRLSQWATRLPLAGTLLALILSAAFLPRVLQKPLDNRLMRFLATISFNLYIWHQALSVLIARGLYPQTLHSDLMLQQSFTLLCYSLSIVVAMAATWGVEKPAARALERLYQKHIAHKGADKP
jgi:peptidoglycan/LPS O-acetylase OafA/YrhL